MSCIIRLLSLKGKVSSKLWIILNARSILSLILPTTKYGPRGHNRDLHFDLDRYWIKVAHLKEPFCQIYWTVFRRKREGNGNKRRKRTEKNQHV